MTGADSRVDASLRRADGLVERAYALTVALEDYGAIDLPPSAGHAADQAQVRAIAVLYLASELESAGIVPATEDLVRLARTGSLGVDLDGANPLLERFWETRNERASAGERGSFFAALFGVDAGPDQTGTARNTDFEDRLIDVCEALYKIDEQASNVRWGGVAQQARIRATGEQLLDNVTAHAGALTVMMAKEMLGTVKEALAVLRHRAVLTAFGARSVGDLIAAIGRRFHRADLPNFDLHARRGQAGMIVLAWLADAAPLLGTTGKPLVGVDHPVVAAAADWLQASLALTESQPAAAAPAGPERAVPQPAADENWAALAG